MPVDDQADIERVVDFYSLRWRIERLRYRLKSRALGVENLRFGDIATTVNALTFCSVVAWQLLAITYVLRENPQASAQTVFEKNEVRPLGKLGSRPIGAAQGAVSALAKIAGSARSERQPLPGVKVLAQAFERFYYIKSGNSMDPWQKKTQD